MNLNYSKKTLFVFTVATLILAACGSTNATPTPTQLSVEAISTNVAATIFAGQTGTASAQPTSTSTPTATATHTATITNTPVDCQPKATATKLVYIAPLQPIFTAAVTTTGTPGTLVPARTSTPGAVGCNNSSLVQDVTIPNNTRLNPGESFTKTWRIKNTGTCSWSTGFKFTYAGGELFNSDTTKIRRNVGPGTTTDFSLNMVAPNAPDKYSSSWQMADDTGKQFGAVFTFAIIVNGSTNTPEPATQTPIPPTPYP